VTVHPRCLRGRVPTVGHFGPLVRFTPRAYGDEFSAWRCVARWTVHPREHGEEGSSSKRSLTVIGSPPCVRGRGVRPWTSRSGTAVHPRAYGEEKFFLADTPKSNRFTPVRTGSRSISWGRKSTLVGSPPCVRGAVPEDVPRLLTYPVHPRAYGEQGGIPDDHGMIYGSPPCVRGADAMAAKHLGAARFTPVRTGKRASRCRK